MRGDLPESVRLSDGRSEPFEPERITRSLFAAAERIGRPDAFLARELTESVLHFLSVERIGGPTSAAEISEVVVKVIRELGHPDLARAFEGRAAIAPRSAEPFSPTKDRFRLPKWFGPDRSPVAVVRAASAEDRTAFSLSRVFPRDLVSAHSEGLIRLLGLENPIEVAGVSAALPPAGVQEAVTQARQIAGEFIAVDGPEHDLAALSGHPDQLADAFLRDASSAAAASEITIVLNLNVSSPPPRLAVGTGPLYEAAVASDGARRKEIARALADRAAEFAFTIWWHLTATDVRGADPDLRSVVRAALAGAPVEFVFDRPRGPVHLAPGIDRQTPATLIQVGVNVARLVELMGGSPVNPEVFLRKVGSLARFAKTAGHVKLDFLRKHGRPPVREAFLVDRARLILVPIGLSEATRASGRPPADFGREILKTLRYAAANDRPRVLPVQLDSPLGNVRAFSAADPSASLRQQVRFASTLLGSIGTGRFNLVSPPEERPDFRSAFESLRLAADSNVCRVRFAKL